jgi:hypothetical protein
MVAGLQVWGVTHAGVRSTLLHLALKQCISWATGLSFQKCDQEDIWSRRISGVQIHRKRNLPIPHVFVGSRRTLQGQTLFDRDPEWFGALGHRERERESGEVRV